MENPYLIIITKTYSSSSFENEQEGIELMVCVELGLVELNTQVEEQIQKGSFVECLQLELEYSLQHFARFYRLRELFLLQR